jgi:uracil-DNA glycosylase
MKERTQALQLKNLEHTVSTCRRCPRLVAWREQVASEKRAAFRDWTYWGRGVPGFGDPLARLLVVGLAPAAHGANRTGRVFTGDRSGDWLYRAMHRAGFANQPHAVDANDGLRLLGAYVTACVKCAPPANKPSVAERDICLPYLRQELDVLSKVRVVMVLGSFAYQVMARELGLKPRPAFGHGVEIALPDGRTLLCAYHPSQQNTFTGRLTETMFDAVFSRARHLINTE